MIVLKKIQDSIEKLYGIQTGLDVRDFVHLKKDHKELGSLLVDQSSVDNLDLAVLLDRDIFEAWNCSARSISVPCEEVSHFVYLGYNHNRGRNITQLEMEIQSEVDRILLAFHGNLGISREHCNSLYEELYGSQYENQQYEEARRVARQFFESLDYPTRWSPSEFSRLRKFFHSDLPEKIYLSKSKNR